MNNFKKLNRIQETDFHLVERNTMHFYTKMQMLCHGKLEKVMESHGFLKSPK